jgi:ABC-type Mn2+/Zn2+ transport system permease subunit
MKPKHRLILYTLIGSTVGSYIPYLWGEINAISFSGLVTSAMGGMFGIFLAYKKNKLFNGTTIDNNHKDEEEM